MSANLKVLLGKHPEKHHGLIARRVAEGDDEATINTKVQAAEMDEKDGIIAGLKAELAAAKANAAKEPDINDDEDDGEGMKAGAEPVASNQRTVGTSTLEPHGSLTANRRGSNQGIRFADREGREAPATEAAKLEAAKAKITTVHQAMEHLKASGSKETGFKLRAAARRAFPHLGDF